MADLFGISVSALKAFQTAITVTGNNIANASTPGYSKETANLVEQVPQQLGTTSIGSGVDVASIGRAVDQAAVNQLNASQSALGQVNSYQTYTNQLDSLLSTSGAGITSALQGYYSAWSTVANDPSSTPSRQALLGQAQTLATTLQNANAQLNSAEADINSRVNTDITQINSLASSIAGLNLKIVGNPVPNQAPNSLLDQRAQLVSQLSQLTNVTTSTETNGALDIFIGNGQSLVVQSQATPLAAVQNPFNPSQVEVGYSGAGNASISAQLTGGDLGGLLAARTQLIDPVRSQLGQIATAVATSSNAQQSSGIDLNGQLGTALFSIAAPTATASALNQSSASVAASITSLGATTGAAYTLTYAGGAYSLRRTSDGQSVALSGAGTVASPLTAAGISLVVSGTPAAGDQFLIQPTANAAGSFQVAINNTAQIAAAGAVQSAAAATNGGTGTISSPTVVNQANVNLLSATNIQFTSATTYSVNGAGSFTYTPGSNINLNGWSVQISGAPATGDQFSVHGTPSGSGDNRNALAAANLQTQGILSNGTVSVNAAVSALITDVGTQAQQTNTAQTAQTAINSQAQQNVQSVSGVNLDEEAASLLQWQQAYEASAKALQIGSSLFSTVLAAVQAS